MNPRLLSKVEFEATFSDRMIDIKDREHIVQPEGVLDLVAYLEHIPDTDFGGLHLLPGVPPSAVYRAEDGRYDHVVYPCSHANVYLMVVIALRPDHLYGHYILDLGKEYGIDVSASN